MRRGIPAFISVMAVALPLGWYLVNHCPYGPIRRWLLEDRPATDAERRQVLGFPVRWAFWSAGFWLTGAVFFAALNSDQGNAAIVVVLITIVLGGLTACSLQYLLVEWAMRPVTALALAGGPPPRTRGPGVTGRLTMAWTLATGVPLVGIAAFSAMDLAGVDYERTRIVGAALFLAALGLTVGLAAMLFAARSVAGPLASMRGALTKVEAGELGSQVPVDDGSEVGLLQAGFNRMTKGLAERETLREAFGAFVDPSLTERVLEEGTDLAGEEVELSLLFMDVRGFTSFAERSEARDVVATLNDLYGEVVPAITRHGGHANKFIGDGLLALFGAPERLPDHADRAVAAAVEIADLVRRRYEGRLRVGVGVNSGRVVVGTIGGGGRLDFTVIGDPVNTAARVESATRETGDDVLVTEATRRLLAREASTWVERPSVPLKGKTEAVRLYAPA